MVGHRSSTRAERTAIRDAARGRDPRQLASVDALHPGRGPATADALHGAREILIAEAEASGDEDRIRAAVLLPLRADHAPELWDLHELGIKIQRHPWGPQTREAALAHVVAGRAAAAEAEAETEAEAERDDQPKNHPKESP